MRVLLASKALVRGAYQRKLDVLAAQPGIDHLLAVVPPSWKEPGGAEIVLEAPRKPAYEMRVCPIRFNGQFHLFYWQGLGRVLRDFKPDVVHVDEEPYNFATVAATYQARSVSARPLFFTWQNLLRRYPPPFSLFERLVYAQCREAIAGNREAGDVLRAKGFRGRVTVIPQVGVDPEVFTPRPRPHKAPTVIGYIGRLVEEKGVWVLLQALEQVKSPWRLHVVGSGPLLKPLQDAVARRGWAGSVQWTPTVPSVRMPEVLSQMDLVVLPSLTRPNWKEQFGRALVEAMACGLPVIGSSSGEIPAVVGEAGLIVREDDPPALSRALDQVLTSPELRQRLGQAGRQRVLLHYTHERIAQDTARVYERLGSAAVRDTH